MKKLLTFVIGGVSAPAEAEAVEHPAEPDGEDVSSL